MIRFKGTYSPDQAAINDQVKLDAGGRCVRCGALHNPAEGQTLTVHHFDGDKSNNERWNQMALCQACHLSVQGRVDPHVSLLIEPAPWAMPNIAGFYEAGNGVPCPTYDLANWIVKYEEEIGPWPTWAAFVP